MEIQKNISATIRRKLREYKNQEEFAQEVGIGHTTLQNILAGRGNPNTETIELLAKGMKISPAQLVSGDICPDDRAFDIISRMLDILHPTLQEAGAIQLEALRQLFRLSEDLYAREARWKYVVIETCPFRYGLRALKGAENGQTAACVESETFTDDRQTAESAADLFTRNSLSPIHLEDAIEDYMNSL